MRHLPTFVRNCILLWWGDDHHQDDHGHDHGHDDDQNHQDDHGHDDDHHRPRHDIAAV